MRPTAKCHKNAQIMIQKNGENHTMIVHSATINCGNNVAAIRNQSKTRKPFKSGLFIFPDRTKSIKLINPCIFPGGWFFLRQIFTFRTSWGGLNKFSCLRFSYARELLPQDKQMICPVICWKLRRDHPESHTETAQRASFQICSCRNFFRFININCNHGELSSTRFILS